LQFTRRFELQISIAGMFPLNRRPENLNMRQTVALLRS